MPEMAAPTPPTATPTEKRFWRSLWTHRTVLLCCLYANLGSFMYGYDNITLSLCLNMAPFVKTFGTPVDGQLLVPAYWQSLWNAVPQFTTGLGAWGSGFLSDRLGRRWSLLVAGGLSCVGVGVVYGAATRGQFLGGKMVNSLGLGMALAAGQTYISEITPTKLRGLALAFYTMALSLGYLIAASISFSRVHIPDASSYKVVFATEWCWPGLLILGAFLVPESPYFHARRGRTDAAVATLQRLHRRDEARVQASMDDIQAALLQEASHSTSLLACFRGTHWRRTRIVLYANGLAQMTGAAMLNNAPYFMVLAGLSPTDVGMIVEVGIAMSIVSLLFTFWALARVGRRTIVLVGVAMAAVFFLVMGIAGAVPETRSTRWTVAVALQLAWLSIGPANGPAMAVAGEVSAVQVRAQTLAVGFFFNYLYSTAWNVAVPYMYSPDEGGLGGRVGFVFVATAALAFAVLWLELPETKDLSFAQLDERFQMRVPTRRFAEDVLGQGKGEPA